MNHSNSESKAHTPQQLGLRVFLRDKATFDTFIADSDAGRLALVQAKMAVSESRENRVFWGGASCGLSHLLQALCRAAREHQRSVQYLPLAELVHLPAEEVLADLHCIDLLCIDDIERISGQSEWELALFHLYNRLKAQGGQLVCAMHTSPQSLDIQLADLRSRILHGATFVVPELGDEGKIDALIAHADCSGMALPRDVANYLLNRVSRQIRSLMSELEALEQASLSEQRKLTIPFVKQVLNIA